MDEPERLAEVSSSTGGIEPGRIGLKSVGELLSYAGAAVALSAAGLVVVTGSRFSDGFLVTVFGIAAVALLAFGWFAGDTTDERRRRVRGVFWLLGLGSAVEVLGVTAGQILNLDGRSGALVPSLLGLALGALLWVLFDGSLQQIGMYALGLGLLATLTFPSTDAYLFGPPDVTAMALVLWLAGAAWLFLAQAGIVKPRRTGCVLGSLTVAIAPLLLGLNHGNAGAILTAAMGAGLILVGEHIAERAVSGVGIATVLLGAGSATQEIVRFSRPLAIGALALGLAALVGALALLRGRGPGPAWAPPEPASRSDGLPPAPPSV